MTASLETNKDQEIAQHDWRVPGGRLFVAADGAMQASVRHRLTDPLPDIIEPIGGPWFLDWTSIETTGDELILKRAAGEDKLVPLATVLANWRRSPAAHLAATLDLADILCRAIRELDHRSQNSSSRSRILISPAQVFVCTPPEGPASWRVLVLPIDHATVEEFATASPELTAWLNQDTLFHSEHASWIFLLGATLYEVLVGDLYPRSLSRLERFHRILSGRAGNAARTRTVLSSCLPRSLASVGLELADFVNMLLSPPSLQHLTPAQAIERFEHFRVRLSAPLLASAWEAERHLRLALDTLTVFSEMAIPTEVPWERLASLRDRAGDHAGAAILRDQHRAPEPVANQSVIATARVLASQGAEGAVQLADLVRTAGPDHAPAAHPGGTSEEQILFLLYANARWLHRADESLRWLNREFNISWSRIVRLLLVARISVEMKAWNKLPAACRDARALIARLPNHGGDNGRYAQAYADLLDGIAHLKLVDSGLSPSYLADGVLKLESAMLTLRELDPERVDPAIAEWLLEITDKLAVQPDLLFAYMGAQAFCQSMQISPVPGRDPNVDPLVPWFIEDRLFTE